LISKHFFFGKNSGYQIHILKVKKKEKGEAVVRRLTVGPTGQEKPARDLNPESSDHL
jgi:hypothetical protein